MVRLRILLLSLALIASIAGDETDRDINQEILDQFTQPPRTLIVGSSVAQEENHKNTPVGNSQEVKNVPEQPKKLAYDIPKDLYKDLLRFDIDWAFSAFIEQHGQLAGKLIQVLLAAPTKDDISAIVKKYINTLNRALLTYAVSVTAMHRDDMRDFRIDLLSLSNPSKLVDGRQISTMQKAINVNEQVGNFSIWAKYSTATNSDDEHRLAYFREDVGINLHHWHWHLVYPFEGSLDIVKKDRRGELFYYMHHQILARYNAERLSNELSLVKRFNNFREPIIEGYFPKLDSQVAGRSWPSRPAGVVLGDLHRHDINLKLDIEDLERWANRLYEAIYTGHMTDKAGALVPFDEKTGIDVLGNMIEASPVLSPNFGYYGSIHNRGHMAISYCHDPDGRYLEQFAVMGDSTTAMRDPIFYRWHAFIDEFFVTYKNTLKPYSRDELNYEGITVTSIRVISDCGKENHLETFWTNFTVDLAKGLDFTPKSNVGAIFTHLDHCSFKYEIKATSSLAEAKKGVVRIFIAPRIDDNGKPYSLEDQRALMIEMDKFNYTIQPGANNIERQSINSTVTNPFETTGRELGEKKTDPIEEFCGCGWPQYMLVPKGTEEGLLMDLFVMISDDDADISQWDSVTGFKAASTMCGLRNRNYPDPRAMGFPFDRPLSEGVRTLQNFLTPNMATSTIKVQFIENNPKTAAKNPQTAAP
uniref:Phenoloxidase I n=1 Tax=Pimpla hypochondriaca TaxID=135724 RepID=Q9GVA5_PIMHY|nr:phenoloxidase I [Pimpla hypochondriaca]